MQGKLCYFLWEEKGDLEVFNIIVIAFQKLLRKRWKIPSLQIDKPKITDSLNQCVGKKFLHIVSLCLKQRKHNLLSSAEDEKSITKREYINKAHCSLEQSLLSKLPPAQAPFPHPTYILNITVPNCYFRVALNTLGFTYLVSSDVTNPSAWHQKHMIKALQQNLIH